MSILFLHADLERENKILHYFHILDLIKTFNNQFLTVDGRLLKHCNDFNWKSLVRFFYNSKRKALLCQGMVEEADASADYLIREV